MGSGKVLEVITQDDEVVSSPAVEQRARAGRVAGAVWQCYEQGGLTGEEETPPLGGCWGTEGRGHTTCALNVLLTSLSVLAVQLLR